MKNYERLIDDRSFWHLVFDIIEASPAQRKNPVFLNTIKGYLLCQSTQEVADYVGRSKTTVQKIHNKIVLQLAYSVYRQKYPFGSELRAYLDSRHPFGERQKLLRLFAEKVSREHLSLV